MMRRTKTARDSTIIYNNAKASITFSPTHPRDDLPIFQVRFHFAPGGRFDSFPHFHTHQTEYLYCEKGEIRVTLGQVIRIVGPEDGMIIVKPWVVHRWESLGGGGDDSVGKGGSGFRDERDFF
jgi:quercetin dioxygenase-like cupin family protein